MSHLICLDHGGSSESKCEVGRYMKEILALIDPTEAEAWCVPF